MAETLNLSRRTLLGKNAIKKLRCEGVVPGVVYGRGREAIPVQIAGDVLRRYLHESGRVVDMVLEGEEYKAVVKEVQHDIFTDDIQHVDLQLVSLTEKITIPVPVVMTGELSFQPDQGTLEQVLSEVEVECLPQDVPEEIRVEISNLDPGGSIHVSDLTLQGNVVMITPAGEVVATVVRPTIEEEETPAVEEKEAEEPEVVGTHKKEEEKPE